MPAFRTSGSTGIAPTTSWMGAIADRGLSMQRAQHYVQATNSIQIDSFAPANYVNLWTPYNTFIATGSGTNAPTVSVGATVTAPDGTSTGTASHITEAANTGIHSMIADAPPGGFIVQLGGWSMRLAVIAKAAERTRIALTINGNAAGSTTVFDLAGVQIGVANTIFNFGGYSNPIAGPASITSLGGGWCLCMMDVYYQIGQNIYNGITGSFDIDAGSGTGAIDTSYAGNGTSGVYAWRSSMLPPAAFAMNGAAIFHDDFNDIGTIDVNNTVAPGYKWYVQNQFPAAGGWSTNLPTPSNQISVSGSNLILQQAPTGTVNLQTQLMSAAAAGTPATATSYVGQGFVPPFLFESKFSTSIEPSNGAFPHLHWFLGIGLLGIPYPEFLPGVEIDCWNFPSYASMGGALFTWNQGDPPGLPFEPFFPLFQTFSGVIGGYRAWNTTDNFAANGNDVVSYGGNFYVALNMLPTNNINNQPDISPSFWALITPRPATNASSYDILNLGNMNIYNTLVLPTFINSAGQIEAGWVIEWFNQAPTGPVPHGPLTGPPVVTYSPLVSNAGDFGFFCGYIQRWTIDPLVLVLFAGFTNTSGPPDQYDYVTIMQ